MDEQHNGVKNAKNGGKPNGNRRHRGHKPPVKDTYTPPYSADVLAKPLSEIGLSEATLNALTAARLATVGDVCRRRAQEMYRVQNFGKRNLADLGRALAALKVNFRPDAAPDKPEQIGDSTPNEQKGRDNNKARQQDGQKGRPQQDAKPKQDRAQSGDKAKMAQPKQGKNKRNGNFEADDNLTLDKVFPKPQFVRSKRIEPETDRFVKFQRGGKWGFKDKGGKEVIPPIYDEVFNFKDEMACVERKQLFGFINRDNELVIPYRYECASSFSEGYACVGDETHCGFINKQGDVVVPFIYEACTAVVDGHSHVKQDGKWGTLDLATNDIIWS